MMSSVLLGDFNAVLTQENPERVSSLFSAYSVPTWPMTTHYDPLSALHKTCAFLACGISATSFTVILVLS